MEAMPRNTLPRVLRMIAMSIAVPLIALASMAAGIPPSFARSAASVPAKPAYPVPPYQLWPRFSTPETIDVVNLEGSGPNATLAAVTLQGAYNQQQQTHRIYTIQTPGDQTWLQRAIPKGIALHTVPVTGSGPHAALITLLTQYARDIHGVVVANPSLSATIDVATTLAGIDDAMVITPRLLPLAKAYHLPIIANLLDYHWASNSEAEAWAVSHLLSQTSKKIVIELNPSIAGDLRDYAVASRAFVFWVHITQNFQDQPLFRKILRHTPPDTPIMGYIPNESVDVAALSALGHFLNASDWLSNESVWAALPSPASLRQPAPSPIQARPNTVYIGFMVSDGDNAQYMEHRMRQLWSDGDLGKVPEGWTMPPGIIDYAPTLMEWYYRHLPANNEFVSGPSGVGYATALAGENLTEFGRITHAFLQRDHIALVDYWGVSTALTPYTRAAQMGALSFAGNLSHPYENVGGTAIFAQSSGYIDRISGVVQTIESQAAKAPNNQPLFLSPLIDAWNLSPHDVYVIAQDLAVQGAKTGTHYVFVTPGVLAQTMTAYYGHHQANLTPTSAQAVPARTYLPGAGKNLVQNPSGGPLLLTLGWSVLHPGPLSYLHPIPYHGHCALYWSSHTAGTDAVSYYPGLSPGRSYEVSAQLAGSGTVELAVWNGEKLVAGPTVHLQSQPSTVRMAVSVPAGAPTGTTGTAPYLEILKPATSPKVSVYIRRGSAVETAAASSASMFSEVANNLVENPSGAGGATSGWDLAYSGRDATLTSTAIGGNPSLAWSVNQAIGHGDWVSYYPAVQNGETYTFNVTLSGSGQADLNVWTGTENVSAPLLTLSGKPQTEALTVTIPTTAPGGQTGSAPQLQIVTPGTEDATVDIQNASVRSENLSRASKPPVASTTN